MCVAGSNIQSHNSVESMGEIERGFFHKIKNTCIIIEDLLMISKEIARLNNTD